MLLTAEHLGHETGLNTVEPVQSTIAATYKTLSLTTNTELFRLNRSMKFFSKFTDKFHVKMKPLFVLLHDKNNFNWNFELETLFQQIKISITKVVAPTFPDTNLSFFITVESSLIGIGCVFFSN